MISFKIILGFLLGLMVTAIAVLGVVSYQYNKDADRTAFWIKHTYEVLDKTDELSSVFMNLQLESNSFFMTGDSVLISGYKNAREDIQSHVDDLRNLTKEDDNQQVRVDSLETLLNGLTSFTDSALIADRARNNFDKISQSSLERNSFFRTKIGQKINSVKKPERKLLVIRERAHRQSIEDFRMTFFELLAGMGLLLATTFFLIRYNFNKRVQVQAELKSANELFYKLFHENPTGVVITQISDGKILDCNESYSELLKFNHQELLGKTAVELKIIKNLDQRSEILKVLKEKGVVRDMETFLQPKHGDPIWVSVSMQIIKTKNQDECVLSVILDMTKHKEAEERIKDALTSEVELNKMKSNFVTLASHEFRTPLTTILSSAFLLENYSFGENRDKIMKHLARIKSSVKNLTSILDEFLSLTKIEEGQVQPSIEYFNLKKHMETVCQNLQTFAKPGQNIVYTHSGEENVFTDPVLLRNITNNLVSNAIKYSPENSTILVSSLINSQVHLSIKDSGIGISEEDQKQLFTRFYRASNAGSVQGTGLGLHIMKHYVDMLNGSVQLTSQLGKGTEVEVIFDSNSDRGFV